MPAIDKAIPLPPDPYATALSEHVGDNPFAGPPGAAAVKGRKLYKDEMWTAARRREQESTFEHSHANDPCIVMNFNPFPLFVNGGYVMRRQIPACSPKDPFVFVVLDETIWTTQDQGAGLDNIPHFYPWPVHPAAMAAEYIRAYTVEEEAGGVIAFFGKRMPRDLNIEVQVPVMRMLDEFGAGEVHARIEREKRNLKQMVETATKSRTVSLLRRIERAMNYYSKEETRSFVTDKDRDEARFAKELGVIEGLPPYCLEKALTFEKPQTCPACQENCKAGVPICTHCQIYVFDIVKAYDLSMIEYGHLAFDRATEDELKQILAIKASRDGVRQKLGLNKPAKE